MLTSNSLRVLPWQEFFEPSDFPVCIFRMPFYNFCDVLPHVHEFDELTIVTGGMIHHDFGDEVDFLSRGDVFYIPKGRSHKLTCPQGCKAELINVLFDFSKLPFCWFDLANIKGFEDLFWKGRQSSPSPQRNKTTRIRLNAGNLASVLNIVQDLEWELAKRNPGYCFMALTLLAHLICILSRHASNISAGTNRWTQRLIPLLCFLEQHLADPITIEQMSQHAGMSPSSLRKAFQETFQESPVSKLHRMRVEKSIQLMADEDLTLTDIAMQVGFNDSNYYTRIFRRLTGHSPSKYRKHNKASAGARPLLANA